jgi:hypothetical protein
VRYPRWSRNARGDRAASYVKVKVKGELTVAAVLGANALQGLTGGRAHTVSLQPALHPDVATFGISDLGQLHNAAAVRAFERVIVKALFDPLAPREMPEGLGQGFQVEDGWRITCEVPQGRIVTTELVCGK